MRQSCRRRRRCGLSRIVDREGGGGGGIELLVYNLKHLFRCHRLTSRLKTQAEQVVGHTEHILVDLLPGVRVSFVYVGDVIWVCLRLS